FDQIECPIPILRGERVVDRFFLQVVLDAPLTRLYLQLTNRVCLFLFEFQAQKIREEVVITKPLATIVEANQKQVGTLQLLEHFVPALVLSESIAERSVQAREDRGSQQKVVHLLRLAIQDFFQQVVQYKTVVAGKLLHQFRAIRP